MQFIPEIETLSLKEQAAFQMGKLTQLLRYLDHHSTFYQRTFAAAGIDIGEIRSLDDLKKLPLTTKEDLQRHNNDFLCIHPEKVREYTATSGTLGKPVTIALSQRDIDRLAYNEYLSFHCMAEGNIYQLMLTLDRQFMAGIAYYNGLQRSGKTLVRTGPGLPAMQWEVIDRLQTDTLITVPSFLVKMIEYAEAHNISLSDSPVRRVLAIGESLRSENLQPGILAEKIKSKWNVDLYGTYAATEMQTAFTECPEFAGGHHHPELVIVELLDEQGNEVEPGTPGEVTITTLGVEAMPLLRYKTGDICKAYYEPCKCGRNSMRLGPVLGRKEQMIKYKGTSIYPAAIINLLYNSDLVAEFSIEISNNAYGQDHILLHLLPSSPNENIGDVLRQRFQEQLRVVPDIKMHDPASMQQLQFPSGNRKPVRFIDLRK